MPVTLTRDSGGRNVKSTLRMTKPGVYEGNEGPKPYTCVNPIGRPGQFTGCKETFENVDLRGTKTGT